MCTFVLLLLLLHMSVHHVRTCATALATQKIRDCRSVYVCMCMTCVPAEAAFFKGPFVGVGYISVHHYYFLLRRLQDSAECADPLTWTERKLRVLSPASQRRFRTFSATCKLTSLNKKSIHNCSRSAVFRVHVHLRVPALMYVQMINDIFWRVFDLYVYEQI